MGHGKQRGDPLALVHPQVDPWKMNAIFFYKM
jgi:hypothetical protein